MRVTIVHTIEHALTALEAAAETNTSIILQSAPDAIFYAGSLYLLHMFEEARRHYPDVRATCIIDCADASGEAIAAMQMGHRHMRSSAPDELRDQLAGIARENDIAFYTEPFEALDLLYARDPRKACREWLKSN
jgi:hypothetical protein